MLSLLGRLIAMGSAVKTAENVALQLKNLNRFKVLIYTPPNRSNIARTRQMLSHLHTAHPHPKRSIITLH